MLANAEAPVAAAVQGLRQEGELSPVGFFVARRIVAAILAADLSRALLVRGLLLPFLIPDDALLGGSMPLIDVRVSLSVSHGPALRVASPSTAEATRAFRVLGELLLRFSLVPVAPTTRLRLR